MTMSLRHAMHRLCDVLEAENAALAGVQYGTIGGFLEEKMAAMNEMAELAGAVPNGPRDDAGLGRRLAGLAVENKRLLEQAITVQNRIMSVLADAARQMQQPKGYGAGGRPPMQGGASAVALLVRA